MDHFAYFSGFLCCPLSWIALALGPLGGACEGEGAAASPVAALLETVSLFFMVAQRSIAWECRTLFTDPENDGNSSLL